jgi:hypothetical protein
MLISISAALGGAREASERDGDVYNTLMHDPASSDVKEAASVARTSLAISTPVFHFQ